MTTKDYTLKALTDIWTGDVKRQGDRLIPTGLLGSIRWWFEVLVRGLGGKACDPTVDGVRRPDANKVPHEAGHHCVVCELFGCTGWARKFRLTILDNQGNVIHNRIKAGQEFTLRFIPLRPIVDEEWCLLDATLRLIANYGAIGGRTVLKPSEEWGIADLGESALKNAKQGGVVVEQSRRGLPLRQGDIIRKVNDSQVSSIDDLREVCARLPHGTPITAEIQRGNQSRQEDVWVGKRHHQDFGLIELEKCPDCISSERKKLEAYVQDDRWRQQIEDSTFSWASLQNFWCVKGRYLARQSANESTFNRLVGRNERRACRDCGQVHNGKCPKTNKHPQRYSDLHPNSDPDRWLAGKQQESKKVFSFKEPENARRTFGFVKPGSLDFDEMKNRLSRIWQGFNPENEFLTCEKIIHSLFS